MNRPVFDGLPQPAETLAPARAAIRAATLKPEGEARAELAAMLGLGEGEREAVSAQAADLVRAIRTRGETGLMEKFLAQYGLGTEEGVALMCLAEAYLRTPDAETLDALIADKIGEGDWSRHLGRAQSALVNASTWALMLTGKVFRTIPAQTADLSSILRGVVQRLGEPVARTAVGEAMKLMGRQFVLGRDIGEALDNARPEMARGTRYSFDMLGEAARTARDGARYFTAYAKAIDAIGSGPQPDGRANTIHARNGISVKLSALHPRYETVNRERVLAELGPRLIELARLARAAGIPFAVDAEEADRLDLSLDLVAAVLADRSLAGWDGFGLVVQAYGRRAPAVIDWFAQEAAARGRRVSVRLVKGAYWDSEVKWAQMAGLPDYPVYTRKETTDLAWLACARRLLELSRSGRVYPQFATHNAHSVSAVEVMARAMPEAHFEFQRLHGMGEALHEIAAARDGRPRRVYAPVGVHRDLLAYLVRRLLENGANSSFVHQIMDRSIAPETIAADPVGRALAAEPVRHPAIPLPPDLTRPDRANSRGWNLADPAELVALEEAMAPWRGHVWGERPAGRATRMIRNPANLADCVGHVADASPEDARAALAAARSGFAAWSARADADRATVLDACAEAFEANAPELMALAVREAGKTRSDAVAELREAVDFLRYYAARARDLPDDAEAAGVVLAISPWNFPLAIFTGQVAGALAAGNTVVAKPAEQTPLIAARAVELMRQAGLPADALVLVQGDGAVVGPVLTGSPDIAGTAFTGSNETARRIDMSMARDGNPDARLIAETGGLNAMIVDSTALPEQAVRDILASAFQSAGQRCSALRCLLVQEDIADHLLEMLEGAARELSIGDPWLPATDVGPAIDAEAAGAIREHCERLERDGRLLFRLDLPEGLDGHFVAPAAFRLDRFADLTREVFGPVLHVVRFRAEELDAVVDAINAAGYGLTLGVHSRIDARVDRICARARVGNIYVNRNQIGAVVGVQPFGGEGLSGTGPKAGGPHYVTRFMRHASPAAPQAGPRLLTGPTGERDSYALHPRRAVAALGPGEAATARQRAAIAASGARLVEAAGLAAALGADGVDAVLFDGPMPRDLRIRLADREGRRIPVIGEQDDPAVLWAERVVSEDTTASGGNASLLAAVA